MKIEVGSQVIIKGLAWVGKGTKKDPIRRGDIEGVVTSIKGENENHINKHKYEVTYKGGRYFTNNQKREIQIIKNKIDMRKILTVIVLVFSLTLLSQNKIEVNQNNEFTFKEMKFTNSEVSTLDDGRLWIWCENDNLNYIFITNKEGQAEYFFSFRDQRWYKVLR